MPAERHPRDRSVVHRSPSAEGVPEYRNSPGEKNMTTLIGDTGPSRFHFSFRALGALLLTTTFSFLLGRATVVSTLAHEAPHGGSLAAEPAGEPPPWSTQGYRDAETAQDGCVTAICNG
jgi:hypothetical protein